MAQPYVRRRADLSDQTIIITGGTGGIGLATARAAAAEKAAVVVVDINPQRIEQSVAELEQIGKPRLGHLGLRVDVRQEADTQQMANAVLERYGRIDALVTCAGILRKAGTPPKPLVETSTEEWDEVLGINLRGIFLCNRAVVPTMIKQRSGTILNISSISGIQGRAHDAPYCASKFGIIGLSQSLAEEVRGYGVRVQAIMPEAVDTALWAQNHPIPPPGDALSPDRVADLILFMLTQPADTVLVGPVIAPLGGRRRRLAGKSSTTTEVATRS